MTVEEALKSIIEDGIELGGGDYIPFETLKVTAKALEEYIEYKHLEEQGLLLRLPCKVGDTVYRLSFIGRDNTGKLRFKIEEDEFGVYQLTAIGTMIFLTREDAEAKLKEMGK